MSSQRLVLFDIDGTLISGGKLWRECFEKAVRLHYPEENFPSVAFHGKTDYQILNEVLRCLNLSRSECTQKSKAILEGYLDHAEQELKTRLHEVQVMPGVRDLLNSLAAKEEVLLGLLTGNVQRGAQVKLNAVELNKYFSFGVYGDDHEDRYELPRIALEKILNKHGRVFHGKEIVIIGDTVHDVNCGKSLGVRSIAVGTGHEPLENLLAQEPDYYFKDFSSTHDVIEAILEELN